MNMKTVNELQLVTAEQSEMLKKHGFDWETSKYYWIDRNPLNGIKGVTLTERIEPFMREYYPAPTISLAFKFYRDVYNLHHTIIWGFDFHERNSNFYGECKINEDIFFTEGGYETYEEAELNLLNALQLYVDAMQLEANYSNS